MSQILVILKSHCDSDFKCSNISFNESRLNGIDLNSNGLDHCELERIEEKLHNFWQTVLYNSGTGWTGRMRKEEEEEELFC